MLIEPGDVDDPAGIMGLMATALTLVVLETNLAPNKELHQLAWLAAIRQPNLDDVYKGLFDTSEPESKEEMYACMLEALTIWVPDPDELWISKSYLEAMKDQTYSMTQ